jgi:hypothetical protein
MASLDSALQSYLEYDTKSAVIEQLWGPKPLPQQLNNGEVNFHLNAEVYFKYYTEQCGLALHDGGRHTSARTHRDTLEIVKHLRDSSQSRDSIVQLLNPKLLNPKPANEIEMLNGSIDLAARLLLMVDFGSLQYGFSGQEQLVWDHGSLKEFIHDYFDVPPALGNEGVKLQKMFNARNLGRIAGVEIVWTNNLADHLRMIDEDKKVAVFHHASFLEYQQK